MCSPLIRNASAVMTRLPIQPDGQLLWTSEVYNQASPAFYYTNAGYWTNIQNTMDLGFMASDLGIEGRRAVYGQSGQYP